MEGCRTLTLGLCLLTGSLGCTMLPERPAPEPAAVAAHKDEPKRQPKAATCIAYGDFAVQSSVDPLCPDAKRQQMREQARKAYQQALEIDPNDLRGLTSLGWLYASMDDRDHALATLQRAVQSHPQDAVAWFELGRCQARYHQWPEALDDLRRAVELDPENHTYSHYYGFSLAHAGKFNESFLTFAKLEGEANAHFEVAQMQHHMKLDDLCKAHLQKALELKPDMSRASELLASLNGTASTDPSELGIEGAPGPSEAR